jgi:glycosyltransferase involved in cell wall biosynthesis
VLDQTYPHIEIIMVDDASKDRSPEIIKQICQTHPQIKSILLSENVGNCQAFNHGWKEASGNFIIDLSADDFLAPERIARQVDQFSNLDAHYGVIYHDACYVDELSRPVHFHFSGASPKVKTDFIPHGEIYTELLQRYYIAAPTMMMKKEVLEEMGGYDPTLAYEDFDFWIRSSRSWKYGYQNEVLTFIRILPGSLSTRIKQPRDRQIYSTLVVCHKAFRMNRHPHEFRALYRRILTEGKTALQYGKIYESFGYAWLGMRSLARSKDINL